MKTIISTLFAIGFVAAIASESYAEDNIDKGTDAVVAISISERVCGIKLSDHAFRGAKVFARAHGIDLVLAADRLKVILDAHAAMPHYVVAQLCPNLHKTFAEAERFGKSLEGMTPAEVDRIGRSAVGRK